MMLEKRNKYLMIRLPILLLISFVYGCATLPPCTNFNDVDSNKTRVIVYRVRDMGGVMGKFNISVDDCIAGQLRYSNYIDFYLDKGIYSISDFDPMFEHRGTIKIDTHDQSLIIIKMYFELEAAMVFNARFTEMPKEEAIKEFSKMKNKPSL